MKISYNWLQNLIKGKLPQPAKLADLLTMYSFETDVVGKKGNDYILEADILPNRAHDCLCHLGVARETAAILKYKLKAIDYAKKIKEKKNEAKNYLAIKVEDKDLCLRYTGRALTNVRVQSSPKWMQGYLTACGLRPINNIVDIANYVMLETGQPLHAFDADKLARGKSGQKTIIIRRAKKGEKITTLDGDDYDLDEEMLLIADKEKPLCIAGIKGGNKPEIDQNTKNIILEAANFSPRSIRQTSQKLKLRTDASLRFEHELDPNLTEEAIDMAACLIKDIAGGQIVSGLVDIYPKKITPQRIRLKFEKIKKLLGISMSDKEVIGILRRLDFGVKNSSVDALNIVIPTRRMDVLIAEDLIEEIGRLYGYQNIPSQFPSAALVPPETNEDLVYFNKVRDILSGFGFDEVYNYSFIGDVDIGFYQDKPKVIEVANPISRDQKYLRTDLVLNLLKNIKENKKYFGSVRLFEIGRIFLTDKSSAKEVKKIGAVISLDEKSERAQSFYALKGVVDLLLNKLRITDQWYDDDLKPDTPVPSFCHLIRRAEIKIGDEYLGWIGEIDSNVLSRANIGAKVSALEIDFDKLVELATEERIYLPPSKYPAIVRDIAVMVERGTKVVEVLNLINAAGGALVRDVDLFDIYEDEISSEGGKSIAFHVIYQSNEYNLTDKEVNKTHQKIIKALEEEGGWEVRK